jgi:ribosomal protein L37E
MSVIYCSECGKKHEYNFAKPNFCSSCGNPFGAAKLKKQKPKEEEEEEDYDDEEEDEDEEDFDDDGESFTNASRVPNIRKIQVEVETSAVYSTFDLGSLIGSESNPVPKGSTPQRRNRPTSLEDFKQKRK